MAVFDASDIVEVAIRIEENGAAFYRKAAGIVRNSEVKALFLHLAKEEGDHRETFMNLRTAMAPPFSQAEGYDEQYAAYLHSYVDHILVFNDEALSQEIAKVCDETSAFNFAIQREFESILYYQEIRGLLRPDQREAIEKIIAEERKHFMVLTEMKHRLKH
ncbi:MAG: ferritin family protein [Deltaproteobacteria bacterium]|nr:ferritin family protein [Deltaproteobacteria bacterium]